MTLRAFLLLWLALAPGFALAAGTAYLGGLEDVPLAPGLTEDAGATVVFDKPGGRIVEAFARGPVALQEAMAFYAAALPQLGWIATGDVTAPGTLSFRREQELLAIEFTRRPSGLEVRFSVTPWREQ